MARVSSSASVSLGGRPIRAGRPSQSSILTYSAVRRVLMSVVTNGSSTPFALPHSPPKGDLGLTRLGRASVRESARNEHGFEPQHEAEDYRCLHDEHHLTRLKRLRLAFFVCDRSPSPDARSLPHRSKEESEESHGQEAEGLTGLPVLDHGDRKDEHDSHQRRQWNSPSESLRRHQQRESQDEESGTYHGCDPQDGVGHTTRGRNRHFRTITGSHPGMIRVTWLGNVGRVPTDAAARCAAPAHNVSGAEGRTGERLVQGRGVLIGYVAQGSVAVSLPLLTKPCIRLSPPLR